MSNGKTIGLVAIFAAIVAITAVWAFGLGFMYAGAQDKAEVPAGGINNSSYSGGNTQKVKVNVIVNCCCQCPQSQPCEQAAAGGGVTFEVVPEAPPEEAPPGEKPSEGKTEQSVFEFPFEPDSANEVINNDDQTTAEPTGNWNQTSTTGSTTPDDW